MEAQEYSSEAKQVRMLLDNLLAKVSTLPAEHQNWITKDIHQVCARIDRIEQAIGQAGMDANNGIAGGDQPDDDHQRMHQALAASEASYQELSESINDGFFELDQQWHFTFINKRAASTIGRAPADLIGKNMWEEFPLLLGTIAENVYREVMETRQPGDFEVPGIFTGNWYSVRVYPSLKGIAIFWIDITERKKTEEQLQEALTHAIWLARFPDENPNPVARVAKDGVILYCNRAAANPQGWALQQGEVLPPSLVPAVKEAVRELRWLEAEVQFGPSYYSVTVVPFPNEEYINLYGRDITESWWTQTALEKNEERFRALADGTPVAIWVTDAEGKIEFINRAYTDFFGATLEDVQNGTWEVLVHPEDTARYVDVYLQCCREQRIFRAQARVRHYDGQWRWIDSYGQPRFSSQGEYLGMAGSSLDITERRQAEEALENAYNALTNERNRLLAVMEALPIGVSIQDRDGGIIQYNQNFKALWGGMIPDTPSVNEYTAFKAWWGDTGQPLFPEEWAGALSIQKGETIPGQFLKIQRFDGSQAFILNSGAPIRNSRGEIIGSAIAEMDVTRLIETENALRESQERFRVALSSVPLLAFTCDRDLRYTWIFNPQRGFRTENVLGKRDNEIMPAEAAAEMIAAKQKAIDTGQGAVQEVRVPLNGQLTFHILTTEPIRDSQGNITGLTCSSIDITEQKRLQQEQQEQAIQIEVQRRLMDRREQDRAAMARDLHDGPVQTLSSIMFKLQLIREQFSDPLLQQELNQVGLDVKNTVRELRSLMNDLRPPALITFGFSKVLGLYIEDLHGRFPDLSIELDNQGDDSGLSALVHLTLFRIFQAGINNIIRHSQASKAWVAYRVDGESFYLELRDNGRGFEQNRDFARLTMDGHFGLVGMKERAEAIGADLQVFSTIGKGTRLVVKGPLGQISRL